MIKTFDDCLDVLEDAVKSDLWKELDSYEQMGVITRLDHVARVAQGGYKNPAELVTMCLDVLQVAFQSSVWRQAAEQEKTPLIGRLSDILDIGRAAL